MVNYLFMVLVNTQCQVGPEEVVMCLFPAPLAATVVWNELKMNVRVKLIRDAKKSW